MIRRCQIGLLARPAAAQQRGCTTPSDRCWRHAPRAYPVHTDGHVWLLTIVAERFNAVTLAPKSCHHHMIMRNQSAGESPKSHTLAISIVSSQGRQATGCPLRLEGVAWREQLEERQHLHRQYACITIEARRSLYNAHILQNPFLSCREFVFRAW